MKKKRGRPRGWRKAGALREMVMIRMSTGDLRYTNKTSRRTRVSKSEFIRLLIDEYRKSEKATPVKSSKTYQSGDVLIEWIDDPGGKVKGQWRVRTSFWEVFPTEAELADIVAAGRRAVEERERESVN